MDWSHVHAILGGTFDPPHFGHFEAAQGILKSPGVGQVWVLPNGRPPQKEVKTSPKNRWKMCQAAFLGGDPRIDLMNEELEAPQDNREYHFTAQTLRRIQQRLPGEELAFVIGTDQLMNLESWREFPELLELSHWIVLTRAGTPVQPILAKIQEWLEKGILAPDSEQSLSAWITPKTGKTLALVPTRAPDVSSSEVRKSLKKTGVPPDGTIPFEVEQLIRQEGLYRK